MKEKINYICLSLLFIMFVVSILPSSNNNDENKTKYENLAKETVSLIKRSIEAGVPEKLPKSLEKLMSKREITKYNAGELRYTGMAFREYPLMKYQNPSLYKDLKKFWKTDRKILARSIPYLEPLYKEEKSEDVKNLIVDTMEEITGPYSGDLTFLETTFMNLYEYEEGKYRKGEFLSELIGIYSKSSGPFDLERYKSMVVKHLIDCKNSEVSRELSALIIMGEKNKCTKEIFNFLLSIQATNKCEYIDNPILYFHPENQEQYNIQESYALKRMIKDLQMGGDASETINDFLFFIFPEKSPTKKYFTTNERSCKILMPYLIKGLDALHEDTTALAIVYLHKCTETPDNESPNIPLSYDYDMATDTDWRDNAGGIPDEDPNSFDKERKQNLIEQQKAVVYWKAWWNVHKKDYPEEMVKYVDEYTYNKLIPNFIKDLDSQDKRIRSKAIAFLQKILKIKDTELPYKVTLATYYNDVREPTTNESEQKYLTHQFFGNSPLGGDDAKQMKEAERRASEYISEHEKAIKFWKAWWEIHKKEYQEDNK